jgi:hypothetical protein
MNEKRNEVTGKDIKEAIKYLLSVAAQGKLTISINESEAVKKNFQTIAEMAESIGDTAVIFTPPIPELNDVSDVPPVALVEENDNE